MKKHKNIIVINGRHYNAKTGETLAHPVKPAAAPPAIIKRPDAVKPHEPAVRQAAKHATPHAPKPTQTLMRQGVKKPSASLKRQLKVQSHLGSQAARTHSRIISRAAAKQSPQHHQTRTGNTQLISHFSPDLFTNVTHITVRTQPAAPVKRAAPQAPVRPAAATQKPRTTAELLEYAVQHASAPEPHPVRKTRRKLFKRHAHAAVA